MRVAQAEPLLQSPQGLNLKIIVLFRDPRAVRWEIESYIAYAQYNQIRNCQYSVHANDSEKPTYSTKSGVLVSVESLGAVFQPAAPLTVNVGTKTKTSRLKLLQMIIIDDVNVANT